MTGLLNPNSSEIDNFLGMILVVYLGHGMFSAGTYVRVAVLFFLQISFCFLGQDVS